MRSRWFCGQTLDSGSQRQVVTPNALSKYLAGQMFLLWKLSDITAPVICGQHSDIKRREQGKSFTTGFIGSWAKSAKWRLNRSRFGNTHQKCRPQANTPVFVLYAYQSQCWRVLLPTKLHCSSSSQLRATSAWATGEEVIRFGTSFLRCE